MSPETFEKYKAAQATMDLLPFNGADMEQMLLADLHRSLQEERVASDRIFINELSKLRKSVGTLRDYHMPMVCAMARTIQNEVPKVRRLTMSYRVQPATPEPVPAPLVPTLQAFVEEIHA